MWKKWVGGILVAAGSVAHFLGGPWAQIGDLIVGLGAAVGAITLHHVVSPSSSSSSGGGTSSSSGSGSSSSSGSSGKSSGK